MSDSNAGMIVGASAAAPWLSVIMPSFRGEQWIDASLKSLASENANGVEVLLVDGSPTRETVDIARKYSGSLNLRIFSRPDLSSWHSKTNYAVGIAEARHICLLCVDDIWLPGRAEAAREWINSSPKAVLHLAPSIIIDRFGRRLGRWRCPLPTNCELSDSFVCEHLLVQNFIASPAPVFLRDAWLACGGLDETLWYTADWDVWLKLAASGSVLYHDVVTVGFRIHSGSLTVSGNRDIGEFAEQMNTVLNRHLPQITGDIQKIERVARASIAMNAALAAASAGNYHHLPSAVYKALGLGPVGMVHYLRDSRILERLAPRVRAALTGAF
jgi:glycosyltransferase involved in cell wall biosynthesis